MSDVLLLDTNVVIWTIAVSTRISQRAQQGISTFRLVTPDPDIAKYDVRVLVVAALWYTMRIGRNTPVRL